VKRPIPTSDRWNLDPTFRGEIDELEAYVNDFASALTLFDHCQAELKLKHSTLSPYFKWQFIAARDGAISIYHFGKTYEKLRAIIKGNPAMFSRVDEANLKESGKLLRALFPKFEAVRHAVAHAGDLDEVQNAASIPGRVKTLIMRNVLSGNEFQNTFDVEIQSYSISQESLYGLNKVAEILVSSLFLHSKPTKNGP